MKIIENNELVQDGLERLSHAARFLGISRSQIYKLIEAGVLPSVKIGRSRRVPIRAVRELAARHLVFVPPVPEHAQPPELAD
jgi:excisionase family DNA binding protein